VYAAPDGRLFSLGFRPTRAEAEVLARQLGRSARVFAIRRDLGLPAREWIAADPDFWERHPAARRSG
jgi:hypothetical protein